MEYVLESVESVVLADRSEQGVVRKTGPTEEVEAAVDLERMTREERFQVSPLPSNSMRY